MIYYNIPYNANKNLAEAYNNFMELLPSDNDYACFVDGDTIFTTPNYGTVIQKIAELYPNVECFTAMTNRVNCKWQIVPGIDTSSNDIEYHRNFGKTLQNNCGLSCTDVTNMPRDQVMSGVLILLKKSAWKKFGKLQTKGMLGVDNEIHWKIQEHKMKLFRMDGIYLYHWYRWPNFKNKEHLR